MRFRTPRAAVIVLALSISSKALAFFGPPTVIPLEVGGVEPRSIAVGDLNGDGKPDVVVAAFRSNGVVVFLGNGTGALKLAATYPVGAGPSQIILADLNLDARLDVVTVNFADMSLSILLGDGAGGFTPAPYSPFPLGDSPIRLRVTDLNNDGRPDLVVLVASQFYDHKLKTFLGSSAGFAPGLSYPMLSAPFDLAVADFNRDGNMDVAVGFNNGAAVYLGSPDGSLSPYPSGSTSSGGGSLAMAAGDVNGDGRVDLVLGGYRQPVAVYLGSGTGTFSPALTGSPTSVYGLALGDVNGDGRLDLVVEEFLSPLCAIYLGTGDGGFAPKAQVLTLPDDVTALAIADLNGDTEPEILVTAAGSFYAASTLTVFLGNDFEPAPGSPIFTAVTPWYVAVGDLNRDGRPDIVTLNDGKTLSVVLTGTAGAFTRAEGSPIAIPSGSYLGIELVDVDGNGSLDAVLLGNPMLFLIGDGSGGFARTTGSPPSPDSSDLRRFADINGDGKIDLVTWSRYSLTAKVYIGKGDGAFQAPIPVALGSSPGGLLDDVAIGDVDGDGVADLVVRRYTSSELAVFLGDGRGGFREVSSSRVMLPNASSGDYLRLADVDRDGRLDAVLPFGDRVQTFFIDATGKLTEGPWSVIVDSYAGATAAVLDMDGDGFADLVTRYQENVSIYLGDGSGAFRKAPGSPFRLGMYPRAIADLNGDGLPDALALDGSHGTLSIFFQNRLSVTPTSLLTAAVGSMYRQEISAAAGAAPYTYTASGNLPFGLTVASTGVLSGVPLARGTYTFSVRAMDSKGVFGARTYTMTISPALPTPLVSLTSTPNPSGENQGITMTAIVSGAVGTPTGIVFFEDGKSPLRAVALSGGSASASASLAAGTHTLRASYVGDASYRSAVSAPIVQTVNGSGVNPTLTLSTSTNPVTTRQSFELTARLDAPGGSFTGSISFWDDGRFIGNVAPDRSGTARMTTWFPTSGPHTIFATYGGNATFSPASSVPVIQYVKTTGGCAGGADDALCTLGGRFLARVDWENPYDGGSTGAGTAQGLTDNSGTFWFFSNTNLELVVKVLDGRAANGAFWVGFGALSDVEYTITIVDAETGNQKTYYNPPKHLGSFLDVNAFPVSGSGAASTISETVALTDLPGAAATLFGDEVWPLPRSPGEADGLDVTAERQALAGCSNGPEALCLAGSQFLVTVAWKDPYGGSSGTGKAVPLTSDTGTFWFFDSGNVELMVKVLNGLAVNGRYWVLFGALSDVEYTITVTDTFTGRVKTYHNDPRTLGSGIDTAAF